jgi:hypothetical protein
MSFSVYRKEKDRIRRTGWINAIACEDPIVPYQSRLVETVDDRSYMSAPKARAIKDKKQDLLDPLPPHNLHHLLRTSLVQPSPRIPIPNIRLDIESVTRHTGVGLISERR